MNTQRMTNNIKTIKPCCVPKSNDNSTSPHPISISTRCSTPFDISDIPGGIALVGTNRPLIALDEESPIRELVIEPFSMMRTTVTNAMFAKFVNDTAYKTEAERIGWSYVFYDQLPKGFEETQAPVNAQWWRKVIGASWNKTAGPTTKYELKEDHPVVHVSWNDAKAYAQWAGGSLPTEAQWEHAARGGLGDVPFPWGEKEPNDNNYQPCNIWQGKFPVTNTCNDGYAATAPAQSFEPNGYGLYNMCGNVWEWTSGRLKISGRSKESKQHAKHYKGAKLLKGGSYLCHSSYCFRYRIAARTGSTPDSTTTHQGFRLVFS